MKFTGERFVPSLDWPITACEHWHRYLFAEPWVAGKLVLDVASGEGYGSFLLAQHAARVVGIDVDDNAVQHASLTYLRDNLEFRQGHCRQIPISGQHVLDVVVSFETIEHIDEADQQAFLREVKRLLRPGGVLLVSTPDRRLYSDEGRRSNPFHRHELETEEFRALLAAHFRQVRILGQKTFAASYIWDVGHSQAGCDEHRLEFADGQFRPTAAAKPGLFALAVCSDGELVVPRRSLLLELSDKLLQRMRELEIHCETLGRRYEALEDLHRTALGTAQQEKERAVAEVRKTRYAKDGRIRALEAGVAPLLERCAALEAEVARLGPRLEQLRAIESSPSWRTTRRVVEYLEGVLPANTRRGQLSRRLLGQCLRATTVAVPSTSPGVPTEPKATVSDESSAIAGLSMLEFPSAENPKVSVLIPVFGQWRLTYACLKSILENTHEVSYEVVLVDDESPDATPDMLGKVTGIRVVRNPVNQGYLRSCNHGLLHCRGDRVLLLNNDTEVTGGWLVALLETMEAEPSIGAVGPKLVCPDGRIIEAGSIIWSDGSTQGYGRAADSSHPAFNYVKDVDYISAACLLVRKELLTRLAGFDPRYAPAYYEDADFCFGVRRLGSRVVYQPLATVIHHENSSAPKESIVEQSLLNRVRFVEKWGAHLKLQPGHGPGNLLRARDIRPGRRVVFFDDMVPDPLLGSGFRRALDMLLLLTELGYVCSFFPLSDSTASSELVHHLQQRGVEVFAGPHARLEDFLLERQGYYDIVLISRPHNAQRLLKRARQAFANAWLIYDAEALYAPREILKRQVLGLPPETTSDASLIEQEIELMNQADAIIAVSDLEKRKIEPWVSKPVHVWGTPMPVQVPELDFDQRRDLLFVGGFLTPGCPNEDAVIHFVREVFPSLQPELGCRLVIAGTNRLSSVEALASENILVLGQVEDLRPLYEQARLFVVPTRFAAGIPLKLLEAMGQGVPAVVTPLIAEQMELSDGDGLLVGSNPTEFAAKVVAAYRDRSLWQSLSQRGLDHVRHRCARDEMKRSLGDLVSETVIDEAELPAAVRRRFPIYRLPPERSLTVRLDLTNTCNLACVQCTLRHNRRAAGEEPGEMPLDLFQRIADQVFPYASEVGLSCEAEPTLHSRFEDILRIVAAHPGPHYSITTNGMALDDRKTEALLESGVGGIHLSIDGATAATYERIRRNGDFGRLTETITKINRWKSAHQAGRCDRPRLQINYTLMHSTLAELPTMVDLCREWNVACLVVQHIYALEQNRLHDESLVNTPAECDAVLRACQDRCAQYGIQTLFPPFLQAPAANPACGDKPSEDTLDCYAPWRMMRIRWNGNVHPCDLWHGRPMGNLGQSTFTEIWSSTPSLRLRWDHARCSPTQSCCLRCDTVTTANVEGRKRRSPVSFTSPRSLPSGLVRP